MKLNFSNVSLPSLIFETPLLYMKRFFYWLEKEPFRFRVRCDRKGENEVKVKKLVVVSMLSKDCICFDAVKFPVSGSSGLFKNRF